MSRNLINNLVSDFKTQLKTAEYYLCEEKPLEETRDYSSKRAHILAKLYSFLLSAEQYNKANRQLSMSK
jgi:hypothetical protein